MKLGVCTQILSTIKNLLTGAVTNPRVANGYYYYRGVRGYSLLHIRGHIQTNRDFLDLGTLTFKFRAL